jgi:hypothetical protein
MALKKVVAELHQRTQRICLQTLQVLQVHFAALLQQSAMCRADAKFRCVSPRPVSCWTLAIEVRARTFMRATWRIPMPALHEHLKRAAAATGCAGPSA